MREPITFDRAYALFGTHVCEQMGERAQSDSGEPMAIFAEVLTNLADIMPEGLMFKIVSGLDDELRAIESGERRVA